MTELKRHPKDNLVKAFKANFDGIKEAGGGYYAYVDDACVSLSRAEFNPNGGEVDYDFLAQGSGAGLVVFLSSWVRIDGGHCQLAAQTMHHFNGNGAEKRALRKAARHLRVSEAGLLEAYDEGLKAAAAK